MPLSEYTNATPPPKKKKKSAPVDVHAPVAGDSPNPQAPATTSYQGHTVPHVFPQGDIFAVNRQVDAITTAFQNRFGHMPSPGLVFDLLRAPVEPNEFDQLFSHVPKTSMAARAAGPHSTMDRQLGGPVEDPFEAAKKQLEDSGFIEEYKGQLDDEAKRLVASGFQRTDLLGDRQRSDEAFKADPSLMGMDPFSEKVVAPVVLGVYQVTQSLAYSPYGAFVAEESLRKDAFDAAKGDYSFKRSRDMAKAIAIQTKNDFAHPLQNPGYLFLDVFGIASSGAGVAARGAAALRAGSAARLVAKEGISLTDRQLIDSLSLRPSVVGQIQRGHVARAVISGAIHRPLPGIFQLGPEGAQETRLLSENALLRAPQRWYYNNLNRKLLTGERTRFDQWSRSILGPEKSMGRGARARARIEGHVLKGPALDLAYAANASWSTASVFQKFSPKAFKGMTPGEEMAILIKSTDHFDPLNAWRDFSKKMLQHGIGDAEAHNANLALYDLAEEALRNPRPKFLETLRLAEQVSNQQQLLKMEFLGLDPAVAEARVAHVGKILEEVKKSTSKAEAIFAIEKVLDDPFIKRGIDESFYYPTVRPRNALPLENLPGLARSSGSKAGIPLPDLHRRHPELHHRFEAKVMQAGDMMIDVSKIIGGAYSRVARSLSVMEDWRRLHVLSVEKLSDVPEWERPYMIRIRDVKGVPDELKDLVSRAQSGQFLEATDAELLGNERFQDLQRYLFPKEEDAVIEGVRYVNKNYQAELSRFPSEPPHAVKILSAIQDPLRVTTLYAKPSYMLNMLGNTGMMLFQSFFTPKRMVDSLRARKNLGEKVVARIDELVGEGKALSFTPEDKVMGVGKLGRDFHRFTQGLAHGWSIFVDRWMRRAAFLEEAQKLGYKTSEDFEKLFNLKDPASKKNLYQVSERANKAMVQFDNLTEFEKNTMRHLVFVYPWVSRSAVWGLKTMMDHPLKTWTAAELGRIGEDKAAEFFSNGEVDDFEKWAAPDWFKRTGYMPVARMGDGSPVVLNPGSVWSFATMNELYTQGRGMAPGGDPFVSALDMAGPGVEFLVHAATNQDQFGDPYDKGPLIGSALDTLVGLPQVRVATGGGKKIKPLPGMMNQYGSLVLGGLWPKQVDLEELASSYYKENPVASKEHTAEKAAAQRLQSVRLEIKMIRDAENVTATIVGQPVPREVKDAVNMSARFAAANVQFANENGHMPTPAEQRSIIIGQLEQMGRITPTTAADLQDQLKKAAKSGDLTDFTTQLGNRYLHLKEVTDWHDRRNAILRIANNLGDQLDYLRRSGLYEGSGAISSAITRQDLKSLSTKAPGLSGAADATGLFGKAAVAADGVQFEVARKYYEYEQKLNAQTSSETSDEESFNTARNRYWQDQQDKPIVVDGAKFPSPLRLKWAAHILEGTLKDPDYEQKQLAALSVQGWDTLTNFEKELVWKKPAPDVSKGWVVYNAISDGYRGKLTGDDVKGFKLPGGDLSEIIPKALPQGQRELSKKAKIDLAKYVDKFAPGFYKDYLFSIQPKYRRISYLPFITKSPAKKEWVDLLTTANAEFGYIASARAAYEKGKDPGYTITGVQDSWKDYVRTTLYPYFQRRGSEDFQKELEMLGGEDFLRTLIDD